jgi:hypothetical protein
MSVQAIGEVLGYRPDIIAQCIALHLYLERQNNEGMPIPPPREYVVPDPEDIITQGMLAPADGMPLRKTVRQGRGGLF